MIITARAPLRLGIAGGGSDVSPFCDLYGGYVLNATIDRYAYAVLKPRKDGYVGFEATDKQVKISIPAQPEIELDGELDLHKAVYNHMVRVYHEGNPIPVAVTTFCDAPPGSGLGSSSTLVVAMIKAFVELLNLPLGDYDIGKLAVQIEREDCGLQGGRQDQYSASFGGFNFMEFYDADRTLINPLRIKPWILCELEASLVLYFTGVSRESAKIIADQSQNVKDGSDSAIKALHNVKAEALVMKEALLRGDFEAMIESVKRGWESKKGSARTVSNSYIDEIYDTTCQSGARAGKVSGAGGGGFMWFFVPTEKRMDVIRTLNRYGGQVSNCHFTKYGMQAWRLP